MDYTALHRMLCSIVKPDEVRGDRGRTYVYRWPVITTDRAKVYVHRFVPGDSSRALHDHPRRFWSVGLWGEYVEVTERSGRRVEEVRRAPWVREFSPGHQHSVRAERECWTIAVFPIGKEE